MKNRDIEADEINKITAECPTREKAFFTIMRQSGLAPNVIRQLKIKNVERILEPNTPVPCRITLPQETHPAFIGEEATNYIHQYLDARIAAGTKLTPESLLFIAHNNPNKEINTKDVSRTFKLAAQKLQKRKKITFEVRIGKPSELRLYSLIKFYRKNARDYLAELNNKSPRKDDVFYRRLYERKAMPLLEIEPLTPTEMRQLKKQQQELESKLGKITVLLREPIDEYEEWLEEHPEEARQEEQRLEEMKAEIEKWEKDHPEEVKLEREQIEKQIENLPEESEEDYTNFYVKTLEERVEELESKLRELENIVKKPKENRIK